MNYKILFLIGFTSLTMISCQKKASKPDVKPPKVDITKYEDIIKHLEKPKKGFECELEDLNTGGKSQVFYLDRSKQYPKKPLFHKIYTVNPDGKSAEPNITIGKREVFFNLSYTSNTDGIYKVLGMTLKSSTATDADYNKKLLSVDAKITFDSKVNEFEITLMSNTFGNQNAIVSNETGSAKIGNCVEAEMKITLGL